LVPEDDGILNRLMSRLLWSDTQRQQRSMISHTEKSNQVVRRCRTLKCRISQERTRSRGPLEYGRKLIYALRQSLPWCWGAARRRPWTKKVHTCADTSNLMHVLLRALTWFKLDMDSTAVLVEPPPPTAGPVKHKNPSAYVDTPMNQKTARNVVVGMHIFTWWWWWCERFWTGDSTSTPCCACPGQPLKRATKQQMLLLRTGCETDSGPHSAQNASWGQWWRRDRQGGGAMALLQTARQTGEERAKTYTRIICRRRRIVLSHLQRCR